MFKKNRAEKMFAISVTVHLLLGLLVTVKFPKPKPKQTLEIAFLVVEKKAEAPPLVQKSISKASLKMVNQDIKPEIEKEAPDTKYLSQFNQTVAKQTRAKNRGRFKNSKAGGHKSEANTVAKNTKPTLLKDSQPPLETVSEAEIAMRKALGQRPKISESPKASKEIDSAVTEEESATDDHVIADDGAETLINTREFKYYAYCKRIKDKIQVLWEPKIKAKVVRELASGRELASLESEKTTKTIIILDSQGTLEKVQVISASGLRDLDESAIEAFRAAAPFPNPPKGIVDHDGKIRIRWDFVVSEAN